MKKYGNMEIWKYEKNKKNLKKDLIFKERIILRK